MILLIQEISWRLQDAVNVSIILRAHIERLLTRARVHGMAQIVRVPCAGICGCCVLANALFGVYTKPAVLLHDCSFQELGS